MNGRGLGNYRLYCVPKGLLTEKDLPEGGYEYQINLKSKPATNVIEFTLETQGLDFFYQPPLTEEMDEHTAEFGEDIEVTGTDVKKNGKIVRHRPENIVGSYIVYASDSKINYVGGKEYKA